MGRQDLALSRLAVVSILTVMVLWLARTHQARRSRPVAGDRSRPTVESTKWLFILIGPVFVVIAAITNSAIPRLPGLYWDRGALALAAAMSIPIGLSCRSFLAVLSTDAGGLTPRRKWFVIPTPMILAAIALTASRVDLPSWVSRIYWHAGIVGIAAPAAVQIGLLCFALKKKVAETRRDEEQSWYWVTLLTYLVVTATALAGLSSFRINRVFREIVEFDANTRRALLGAFIASVDVIGFGLYFTGRAFRMWRRTPPSLAEVLLYVVAAGIIARLPLAIAERQTSSGNLVDVYYTVNFIGLGFGVVLLASVAAVLDRMRAS
jgi:hypothetical protein